MFSTHADGACFYLTPPTGLSCTVAVTARYVPPTSDTIASLGLVLHADMDSVEVQLRKQQVNLCFTKRGVIQPVRFPVGKGDLCCEMSF